ncbi:MAG: prolipoprotein diacylglyceryl transferase [Phycisphaerales bacterium]|nr:prolipoprotein diacylglyceryl transferase [Hyphomonadaceae bacterium]
MIEAAFQFPNINPAALTLPAFELFGNTLGPFPLRWYALAYIVGLVLGWRWMVWLIRRDKLWAPGRPALSVMQADDFLFWATLGVILGGRLGYVLFYKTDMLWLSPLEVFQIWQGGMSFHGGLIGVALAAFWFARQKHVNEEQFAGLAKKHVVTEPPADNKSEYTRIGPQGWLKKKEADDLREKARTDTVDLLRLGDIAAAAAPIGLFFGRIANFINGELWGRTTDGPLGVVFCNRTITELNYGTCPAGVEPRHPSQLYEAALEGVALFAIISIATLRFESLRRPGLNVGLFLLFYGLFRAILETVREPDSHMPAALQGYVTMGMLLSIPMIVAGLWLIRRAFAQPKLAPA